MSESRLALRALPFIVAAYLGAPFVAATGVWIIAYGPWRVPAEIDWPTGWGAWLLTAIVVVPICLAMEIVIATPLLVGFSRWRWRWMNTWSLCALGFLVGALTIFGLEASQPPNGTVGDLIVDSVRTFWGWLEIVKHAAAFGLVGAATALTFRLIAVKRAPAASA